MPKTKPINHCFEWEVDDPIPPGTYETTIQRVILNADGEVCLVLSQPVRLDPEEE